MQIVERWIMARLRHHRFETIESVNDLIRPLLKNLNGRLFQKLPGCRATAFAELDAPALQPLPVQPYELARFKLVTVHIDYHVEIDKHRYSVPQALVGLKLDARITAGAVELLHRGRRAASHARNDRVGGHTTVVEHMPAAHRAHLEWTPQRLIHWCQQVGGATGALVTRLSPRATPSRTRLSGVPWTALALSSLRPRASGSGVRIGTRTGRTPLPDKATSVNAKDALFTPKHANSQLRINTYSCSGVLQTT